MSTGNELQSLFARVAESMANATLRPDKARDDLLGTVELAAATARSVAEGIADALREATTGQFVNRERLRDFETGVGNLRLEIGRLAARIRMLEAAGQHNQDTSTEESAHNRGNPAAAHDTRA